MISMNTKRTMISNMMGSELRMVETKLLIPGMELMVLRGLKSLMTLMAEIFCCDS